MTRSRVAVMTPFLTSSTPKATPRRGKTTSPASAFHRAAGRSVTAFRGRRTRRFIFYDGRAPQHHEEEAGATRLGTATERHINDIAARFLLFRVVRIASCAFLY